MSKIKLHNRGARSIIVGDVEFKPKQTRAFAKEDAEKLLILFSSEVEDIEAASALLDDVEGEDESWDDSTVKEIKSFLDELGVKYDKTANKADLIALAEAVEDDE